MTDQEEKKSTVVDKKDPREKQVSHFRCTEADCDFMGYRPANQKYCPRCHGLLEPYDKPMLRGKRCFYPGCEEMAKRICAHNCNRAWCDKHQHQENLCKACENPLRRWPSIMLWYQQTENEKMRLAQRENAAALKGFMKKMEEWMDTQIGKVEKKPEQVPSQKVSSDF